MTRFIVIASAVFWVWITWGVDRTGIGWALVIGLHALLWMAHSIEVKLNRLLDHYGIHVSKDQINNG